MDAARALFFDHATTLNSMACHVIYTFPISLCYSNEFRARVREYSNHLLPPNVHLYNRDDTPHPEGREVLKSVVTRRISEDLFDRAALNLIGELSGGLMRDLIRLVRDAALQALTDGKPIITPDVVPRRCELVGDLPLVIELIAPRAAELPLTELEKMVSRSLDAIAAEKHLALDQRHRSIAACFPVSFDRLSEDARALLTRLSILPDGASADIIPEFTGIEAWQQPIAECVRHSLLNLEGVRYRSHPPVRRRPSTPSRDGQGAHSPAAVCVGAVGG